MTYRVRVSGDKAVNASLKAFNREKSDLEAFDLIGVKVKADALTMVPVLTGKLKRSIKAESRNNKTTVSASAIDPKTGFNYAGIQHYGGFASGSYGPHYIKAKPFLTSAMNKNEDFAHDATRQELNRLIRLLDLK